MKNYYKYLIPYILLILISCSGGGGENSAYQYHTPDEIEIFLDEIQSHYSNIAKVESIGTSESGREIKALIISDNPENLEGEPAIRLTGGIHGNEKMSVELLLRFIEYLTSNYNRNTEVTDIVNSKYICIIPVLNPDGLADNSRYNSNGVDLNRNFNATGSSLQSETKALQDYSLSRKFNLSVTYHTGAVLVNMPFDYGSEIIDGTAPVENNLVKSFALAYTTGTGSKFLDNPEVYTRVYNSIYGDYISLDRGTINGGDWYVINGSLQDWSYTQTGCLDLTIEITKRNPDTESGVEQIFMYNRDSLIAYINKAEEGIYGRVTDANGYPVEDAAITASLGATAGDLIIKTDHNGYYNRILLPGTYNVTFSKSGYTTQTENDINVSGRSVLNVQL